MVIPIIGDFGISKLDLEKMKQTHRLTKGFDTTPLYQAPEVINQSYPTAKVDLWALGIILYEMLAQKHPFEKETVHPIIAIGGKEQHEPLPSTIS